ncbi:3-dehydroquinate dehydratase [Oligoflexaceae bacterium]|nr:3-dehydroquinate dehydratase [Oligoflexaceae bacterium]
MKPQKILIANGVNLDLLGQRENDQYGSFSLSDLEDHISEFSNKFSNAFNTPVPVFDFFQSNEESAYLEKVSSSYDALILNPGAWTHTSIALADRLRVQNAPIYEVHISNVHSRESYRKTSFVSELAVGVICGLGMNSYTSAVAAHLLSK